MTQVERCALWFAFGVSTVSAMALVAWWFVVVAAVAAVVIGLCWAYEELS